MTKELSKIRKYTSKRNSQCIDDLPNKIQSSQSTGLIIHKESGLCLDAEGGHLRDLVRVILYPCHNGVNQKWHQKIEDNKYVFSLGDNKNYKVLDVEQGSKKNCGKLIIYNYHGGDNQKFFWDEKNGTIKAANSNKCLTARNAATMVQLSIYDCNNSKAQIFEIRKIN